MTREEAIAHGKEQLEVFGGEHREFIEMAIKALDQEPSGNAINRQAVLDLFNRSNEYSWEMSLLRKKIEKMPSVTLQEPRKVLSIDDVMSVFDDFMCGEVDEDGTETFLEMLKDKAESEK